MIVKDARFSSEFSEIILTYDWFVVSSDLIEPNILESSIMFPEFFFDSSDLKFV